MERIQKAIRYAEQGINVFPCDPYTKAPLTTNGFKGATSDLDTVTAWWTKHPTALIAAVCGQFTVLDVDDYCVPDSARTIIDAVLSDLKDSGVIADDSFKVRTKNGGTHFYFKNELPGRLINFLPAIDLLGDSGYVILPDQESYVCLSSDTPWEDISVLAPLEQDGLWEARNTYKDDTKKVKKQIKEHREKEGFKKTSRPAAKKKSTKKVKKPSTPTNQKQYDDTVEFEITDGIYTRAKEVNKVDPYAKLLDENGTLHVDEGMLNSDMINMLFHNREVQERLAKFLDLELPSSTKGSLMRSPLPGHIDSNPSFGMRWSEDGSHLICRDFSNHFADHYQQTDFNLVRLYAVLKYGTNVPRLSKNEFVTWFLRMMHDSGIMNVDHLKQEFYIEDLEGFTKKQKHILRQFQLLDALKRTYEGYEGSTAMARNFGAAWCDVAHVTFTNAMNKAREKGVVVWVDNHQGKKGMRPMKVYRVGTDSPEDNYNHEISEVEMKLNEAFSNQARSPFKTDAQKETEKREKEMNKKYGDDISTMVAIKIGAGMHEKITAFCEDFGVEEVASEETMILPLLVKDGYTEIDLNRDEVDSTWYVPSTEVKFYVEEGDFGNNLLIAEFTSGALGDLREMYFSNYHNDKVLDSEDELDIFDLVISSDVEPSEFDQEMLNKMSLGFSAYIPSLSFSKQVSGVMGETELLQVLNGYDPSEDRELA